MKIADLRANNTKYLFFMNASTIKGYKGLSAFAIRELNANESLFLCADLNANVTAPPLLINDFASMNATNYTNNFSYLVYSSGCYYYNKTTGEWKSDGVEVLEDTNLQYTHCVTNHLTTFAGGWVVLPTAINFDYVFANASIDKNPTIYATVITLFALYIIFAIWARYMDKEDVKKIGVTPLPDNQPGDTYYYEIVVFTGSRQDAGTNSRVIFI